ncbi:hypothetical protein P3T37_005453 [Kitasatospora sp. MAA4]|uniref:hypothetical protein n=1 Tax=Kitasatospora sp. MAA4 TaxID=3035093 RepID=UPI00247720E8|nr:hypothetical protein [Kitasatospora sp. MAA4]MDH6136034.1 hypothetical protein [Kitasatospora sp. MAA4]
MPQQNGRAVTGDRAEPGGGRAGGAAEGRKRIDLSVAQVAASALAAVVGAVLASELGVYGTIIGAAVVSVGATTGGAVFHHVFRRTGEQLREVTDRAAGPGVNALTQVPLTDTAPVPAAWLPDGPSGEWNDSPVLRARRRWTWKTYTAVSALVFGIAMVPIVSVELAWGKSVHSMTTGQDGGGTSIFPGGGGKPDRAPERPPAERQSPSAPTTPRSSTSAGASAGASDSASPSPTSSPDASRSSGAASPSPSATPTPTPTATPTPTPPPAHSATPSEAVPPAASGAATPSP